MVVVLLCNEGLSTEIEYGVYWGNWGTAHENCWHHQRRGAVIVNLLKVVQ